MTLFVSVFAYAWAKRGGSFSAELAAGEGSTLPAFRTLHRLRRAHELALCLESSTLIARARCRAAGSFLASGLPLWVTIDEDVDATSEALDGLIDTARHALAVGPLVTEVLVFGAMRLRGANRLNVEALHTIDAATARGAAGFRSTFPIRRGGVALAAFPRACVEAMAKSEGVIRFPDNVSMGPGGARTAALCPSLFAERVTPEGWIGEDVAFCDVAWGAGVPMVAYVHEGVTHDGLSNAEVLR